MLLIMSPAPGEGQYSAAPSAYSIQQALKEKRRQSGKTGAFAGDY
jgi:hypothetical protein